MNYFFKFKFVHKIFTLFPNMFVSKRYSQNNMCAGFTARLSMNADSYKIVCMVSN